MGAPLYILKRRRIRRDHAKARTALNRQIAQGHTPLHAQRLNSSPGIFHRMPARAVRAKLGNPTQGHIFGADPRAQSPFKRDPHGGWFFLP